MNIQSISFGKQIPTISCKVKNNDTGKFVPATMYEYDCFDAEDIKDVEELPSWGFKDVILNGMKTKKAAREKYGSDTETSFFVLKNEKGETLGLCYLYDRDNIPAIKFIQTNPNKKYKYAGQTMLAGLALKAQNDKKDKFEIRFATDEAKPFYIYKCGFKRGKDIYSLEMTTKELKKFLVKIFFRTHGKIEDIRA